VSAIVNKVKNGIGLRTWTFLILINSRYRGQIILSDNKLPASDKNLYFGLLKRRLKFR
jgi:hypothetical protein